MKIEIKKIGHGLRQRFWAVYCDGELLCAVLYRKGAQAGAEKFRALDAGKAVQS